MVRQFSSATWNSKIVKCFVMKIIFKCKKCEVKISNPLVGPIGPSKMNYEDEKPHVEIGYYGIVDENFRIEFKNEFIINLEDKINVKYTNDPKKTNGCCGYDGTDGMNTLCINGHEIGTECSDCWMPHGLVLNRERVVKTSFQFRN